MLVSIGQDSHRFDMEQGKPCILGGVTFEDAPGVSANSDGDVLLHALTNAISGVTCRNILGKRADALCAAGITDSSAYVREGLKDMEELKLGILHVSFSVECLIPKLAPKVEEIRNRVAGLLGIEASHVGLTATTGEHLTQCGSGKGIAVTCILTAERL